MNIALRSLLFCVIAAIAGISTLSAQQKKAPAQQNPPVAAGEDPCKKPLDQKKIDEAITRGCAYLIAGIDTILDKKNEDAMSNSPELVLLTLIHGKAFSEKNDKCRKLLEYVLNWEPKFTYRASVKAMALTTLDKEKYIEYIAECGQFLVNTQSTSGAWGYGYKGGRKPPTIKTGDQKPSIRTATGGKKTGPQEKIKIERAGGIGETGGDNSNTQYAALGLRAVHDAGIELPKATLELALQWWEKSQFQDGAWDYHKMGGGLSKTTGKFNPGTVEDLKPPFHLNVMTPGGTSSLAIYYYLLGKAKNKSDFARIPSIAAGAKWLVQDYKKVDPITYWDSPYYSYGIERAGILAEFQKLGDHDWYKEGAHWIVKKQKDGHWEYPYELFHGSYIATCLYILFLKKATEPLIDTGVKEKLIDNVPPPDKSIESGGKKE